MCAEHFEPWCFMNERRDRLVWNAEPTKFAFKRKDETEEEEDFEALEVEDFEALEVEEKEEPPPSQAKSLRTEGPPPPKRPPPRKRTHDPEGVQELLEAKRALEQEVAKLRKELKRARAESEPDKDREESGVVGFHSQMSSRRKLDSFSSRPALFFSLNSFFFLFYIRVPLK